MLHHGNIPYADRYDIQYELASGGMGVVYKAKDKVLDKLVAIKLLKHKTNPALVMRFQKEAKACGRLSHKNILTALDFGVTEKGDPYLVLDFVEGRTLQDVLKQETRIAVQEALPIMLQLSSAMSYAHRQGILHRDLKPSNVMLVEENGRNTVRVLDFGIAKLSLGGVTTKEVSSTGIIGSPKYMSPEQARAQEVDARSDIYSFGCLFFEILTGEPPLVGDTALDTMQKKQNEKAPLLSAVYDGHFPETLESIVDKCLARVPQDRYRSFDDIAADLIALLDSGIVHMNEDISELKKEVIDNQRLVRPRRHIAWILVFMSLAAVACTVFVSSRVSEQVVTTSIRDETRKYPLFDIESTPTDFGRGNTYNLRNITRKWLKQQGTKKYAACSQLRIFASELQGDTLEPLRHLSANNLYLQDCSVDDDTLQWISRFPQLEKLFILKNTINVTPKGLACLQKSGRLKHFELSQPTITDEDMAAVGNIKSLENVLLTCTGGYTAKGVKQLENLPALWALYLGSNVDENVVDVISKMDNLKQLGFNGLQPGQTGKIIPALKRLPKLTTLGFSRCNLARNDLADLNELKRVNWLALNRVRIENDRVLMDISRNEKISTLALEDMGNLQTNQVMILGRKKGLKVFFLNGAHENRLEIERMIRAERPDIKLELQHVL